MSEVVGNVFCGKEAEHARKWLKAHLVHGPVTVSFVKKDGSTREMRCTLDPSLTVEYEKKTDRTKEPNPDVQFVFDIDKREWRSFRFDSIMSVTFDLNDDGKTSTLQTI